MLNNKKIIITGGAGFIGKSLINKLYESNEITIFSRDESKHYYLKKKYPNLHFVVGDVRNFDLLNRSCKGKDIGIFAASMKQIEAVDQNVEEAVDIIVRGAINSRRASEENEFEASCFISSDKSRAATTLYGGMKFIAGESFIVNADKSNVKLSTAIYGNVLNSTGSVIPLIWDAIKQNYELKLYHEDMTRFIITSEDAVKLIETALTTTGSNIIPNLKSIKIKDLFDLYKEKFGLKYLMGQPRISEKIHEVMISSEEIERTTFNYDLNCYMMHYKNISKCKPQFHQLSSDLTIISKEELNSTLSLYNYFM